METNANGEGSLGDAIRQRRAELCLTQEDLADRTGLSVRTISDIERGRITRPRRSSATILASALQLDQVGQADPSALPADPGPGRTSELGDLVVPRQLPAVTSRFAGRAAEIASLTGLLESADDAHRPAVVAAISGTAGVGKTALAIRWAHQVAARFPDGQLYVDMRGFGPGSPVAPAEAVCGFLESLGIPAPGIPVQAQARFGLYRSLLANRRMLVVLDNVSDADHARPLLPASPGCLTLVTSRNQLTGLAVAEGAQMICLDVLTEAEARDLLTLGLGADRLAQEAAAAGELVELTAGLPLALSICVARASAHPSSRLAVLAAELRDARGRLEALAAGDTSADVRAAISWSYQRLSGGPAQLFRFLGLHPGPDVTVAAAASLCGRSLAASRRALAELAAGGLITERAPGRFACHDLLRVYAVELSGEHDTDASRQQAGARLFDHYLQTAHAGMLLIHAASLPLPLPEPLPGARLDDLRTAERAIDWFGAEREVLVVAVAEAERSGFDRQAWMLAAAITPYLERSGYCHEAVAASRIALAAAARLSDDRAQAEVRRRLGQVLIVLREQEDATANLNLALQAYRRLGDEAGQAATHTSISVLMEQQGRYRDGLDHSWQSLRFYRATGNTLGQALALNNAGWDLIQLGDYEQALGTCRDSLRLSEELDDHTVKASTWDSVALAQLRLGQCAEAIASYRRAIEEYRLAGHLAGEGVCMVAFGEALHSNGDRAAAMDCWRQALRILSDLRHPYADHARTLLMSAG